MGAKETAKQARVLYAAYQESQDVEELEQAILTMRDAIALAPDSTNRTRLGDLGCMLAARFLRLGNLDDIEEAISVQQLALERIPDDHDAKPRRLNDLAMSLGFRFERLGSLNDIAEAMTLIRRAIELLPDKHPDNTFALNNLGNAHRSRFMRLGELDDLDGALSAQRLALELLPVDHPDEPPMLSNLATSLQMRFERLGDDADLENAISTQRRALELAADDDPRTSSWLNNLGDSLQSRYERLGELVDLESAIQAQQQAVDMASDIDPDKRIWLDSFGTALQLRFERLDDLQDLENAIQAHRRAVEFTTDDHASKPLRLSNLGSVLQIRFARHGDLDDLEKAISTKRLAIELTPDDHPVRAERFNSLGTSLQARFERLGELDDLEAAIEAKQLSVQLTPDHDIHKPLHLTSLAMSLHARFERLHRLNDLESAISNVQLAVETTSDSHPAQALQLNNLGCCLQTRFEHLAEIADLERAIETHRLAVQLAPDDDPDKAIWLSNLGNALHDLFEQLREVKHLENALSAYRLAVKLTPDGHPDKPLRLLNLAVSLQDIFLQTPNLSHFEAAIEHFMAATTQSLGNPAIRLDAAMHCAKFASQYPDFTSPQALLFAHSQIMAILPELVWLGHSISRRYEETAKLGDTVNAAVAAAIRHRALPQAVEWLEAGRSFVWSQILSLRLPYDDLKEQYPHLAETLQGVSKELRYSGNLSHFTPSRNNALTADPRRRFTFTNDAADRHRQLVIQYDRTLAEIRSRSGFEDFLRPPKLASLLLAIKHSDGPVVFINVHPASCDALVVMPDGSTASIALPGLTEKRSRQLRSLWMQNLGWCNVRLRAPVTPDMINLKGSANMFGRVLTRLWMWVVQPILQRLKMMNDAAVDNLPHITWCPTGPLTQLPLHAAGVYDSLQERQPRVYDFVVSSYIPSLSALLRCRQASRNQTSQPNVLVIAQPATPGLTRLPGTRDECARLRTVLQHTASTLLEHEQAVVARTQAAMREHPWVHLACHGMQDTKDPTQSAFALYDGRLTLSALMGTTAENAELAFLSACQTAVGDEKVPEEAVHLAAGMLAVGFKGVVATMWSIGDAEAPVVVEAYYRKLLELRGSDSIQSGHTGAAYALHEASKVLRDHVGEQNFVKWAPFVHFGV
ncbi:TPR-like protein [Peniophora sp. CONT]|nr:TPR-like protein [Peniophora sp. CONT]